MCKRMRSLTSRVFAKMSFSFLGLCVTSLCTLLHTQVATAGVSCSMTKTTAQLSRTAYNSTVSDKKKYIPSNHTFIAAWSSKNYKGGDHAYTTEAKVSVSQITKDPKTFAPKVSFISKKGCFYTFRGLNVSTTEMLSEFKSMTKTTSCSSKNNKSIGTCSKAPYQRYLTIRKAVVNHITRRVS